VKDIYDALGEWKKRRGSDRHSDSEFAVATRGLVYFHLTVKTGERDLHSGLFGEAGRNLEPVRILPEGLRVNEVDSMLAHVRRRFHRIELELHLV